MKKNKICVYAICKDESKFVKQWLDSMQEADYIVVLDTGSHDNTVELLKKDPRVTKVKVKEIKPWRFDVARNESMKLVPKDADILVCTDFDEIFEPGWAKILRDSWKDGINRVYYTYAWSHNTLGEPEDIFKYDKIHTRDYHWVFPVHEVLLPIKDDFQQCAVDVGEQIYLHHYPDLTKSRSSYLNLLKLSKEEFPEDSHVAMLYARELALRDEDEAAIEEYLKVLRMPDVNAPNKRLVLLCSLLQLGLLYEKIKNYDEAIWYCQEFIKEDPTYREPYLLMGEVYNDMKMYTLAEAMVEAAIKNSVRKYNWVERANTWVYWANDIMSIAKFYLGDVDSAIANIKEALQHDPENIRLLKNYGAFLEEQQKRLTNKIDQLESKL